MARGESADVSKADKRMAPLLPAEDRARLSLAAFQHAPQAVWLVDLDGVVLQWSITASRVVGEAPALGLHVWELPCWHEGAREHLRQAVALRGAPGTGFETSVVQADGQPFTADVTVAPFEAAGLGAGLFLRVDAFDVSERAGVEAELRASEAKFSGILSIAADAIITADDTMTVVHFNRGAEAIFRYSADEVIGRPLDILIPERYRTTHSAHVARFGAGPEQARRMGERREIFGLRSDGEEFPAEASISKLEAPGRRLFTVVLRDITGRKRMEEQQRFLSDTTALLVRTLDRPATAASIADAPVPFLADACLVDVITPTGEIRRTVSRHADPARAEPLRRIGEEFVPHSDSPSRVIDVLRTAQPEQIGTIDDDWLQAHTDSEQELAAYRALGATDMILVPMIARDQVIGCLTMITSKPRGYDELDFSLAKEFAVRSAFALDNAALYEAAQSATRARDDVLGVVSHDLRNPLSAIQMCARVLLETPPTDEESRRDLLEAVYQSAGLSHRMIQDLLDVANIEAGRLSVERRPEQFADIIGRATPMFQTQAADRDIELTVQVPDDLPPVLADEGRVVQVLANLVGNATKFTGAGGRVTIATTVVGEDVQIAVADTGPGIPPEQWELVFERFWHSRRGARQRGTGLGLAIAKGIVEAHGGRIWIESTVGVGSTFYFTIPLARRQVQAERSGR
jgi:PAS domain S-box-containing protein